MRMIREKNSYLLYIVFFLFVLFLMVFIEEDKKFNLSILDIYVVIVYIFFIL